MGSQRPAMLARDSSGKSISLLNNEVSSHMAQATIYEFQPQDMARSHSSTSKTSSNSKTASSPPALIREASYDSRPDHPITPTSDYNRSPYTQAKSPPTFFTYPPIPNASPDSQYPLSPLTTATSYPAQSYQTCGSPIPPPSRGFSTYQPSQPGPNAQKKYECKYRVQHNCDQTFTTSGHASRHSKIHDSLKGIACTHPGCPKKFTRSDNMKQHLETHNKDKKRDKGRTLTRTAGIQKMARPNSRASDGSTDLSQRTKEMYIYHQISEADERKSNAFHTSPISPTGSALDVLAEAANREMKTEKNFPL